MNGLGFGDRGNLFSSSLPSDARHVEQYHSRTMLFLLLRPVPAATRPVEVFDVEVRYVLAVVPRRSRSPRLGFLPHHHGVRPREGHRSSLILPKLCRPPTRPSSLAWGAF